MTFADALRRNGGSRFSAAQPHSQHPQHINGYGDEYVCQLRRHLRPDESAVVRAVDDASRSGKTQLEFRDFVPGSVLAVRLTLDAGAGRAVARLRRLISGSSAVSLRILMSIAFRSPFWTF